MNKQEASYFLLLVNHLVNERKNNNKLTAKKIHTFTTFPKKHRIDIHVSLSVSLSPQG